MTSRRSATITATATMTVTTGGIRIAEPGSYTFHRPVTGHRPP